MTISFMGGSDDTNGLEGSAHWIQRRTAVQVRVAVESTDESGDENTGDTGTEDTGDTGTEDTGDTGTEAATDSATALAEIVIHHVPSDPPAEPVLAVTGDGSPDLEIDFLGGGFLRGSPQPDGSLAWTSFDGGGVPLTPATDYATALAAQPSGTTVSGAFLYDSAATPGGTFTDTVTVLQYNGLDLVPGTNRGHSGHGGSGHGTRRGTAHGHNA
jgi:hypothetical protein